MKFKDILPKYDADANGSYKYEEVESAINSLKGLTNEQRAALWQLQTGGKNNPYSSSVGSKIKTELAGQKEKASSSSSGSSNGSGLMGYIAGQNEPTKKKTNATVPQKTQSTGLMGFINAQK